MEVTNARTVVRDSSKSSAMLLVAPESALDARATAKVEIATVIVTVHL